MNRFHRILCLMLILCLSHSPLPWGHSHQQMDAGLLSLHLQQYHPRERSSELPQGWHWHTTQWNVTPCEQPYPLSEVYLEESSSRSETDLDLLGLAFPLMPGAPNLFQGFATHKPGDAVVDLQQTYLRLHVLLI